MSGLSTLSFSDIVEISKKPFKEIPLRNKILVITLLYYAVSIGLSMLIYVFFFGWIVFSQIPFVNLIYGLFALVVYLILILALGSFAQGVIWKFTLTEYEGKSIADIVLDKAYFISTFKEGIKVYAIDLVCYLPITLFSVFAFTCAFGLDFLVNGKNSEGDLAIILIMLVVMPLYFIVFLLITVFIPASKYYYLKSGKISDALRFGKVFSLIQKEWRLFGLYVLGYVCYIFISSIALMLSYLTIFICIGIVLIPLVALSIMGFMLYYQGVVPARIYKELDSKGY